MTVPLVKEFMEAALVVASKPTVATTDQLRAEVSAGAGASRPLRADARRNRARVLEAAVAAFATEGLSGPVHEIARRAGVGTGTVSRHFPTKHALFQAIITSRIQQCVDQARVLAAEKDPGDAFLAFFAYLVEQGAANRGLADALAGTGFDIEAAAADAEPDLMAALGDLLDAAQQAGMVRDDVDTADVKALIQGCMARERSAADPAALDRMIAIACQGLRARHASA
jgi:AcrR family transcriptional regulator